MDHPLTGASRKLDMAGRCLETLEDEIEARRGRNPHRLTRREEQEGGSRWLYTWSVEILEPLPAHWTRLVGEVLDNARAALDDLAWQTARTRTWPDDPPARPTFPIHKDETTFWRRDERKGTYTPRSGAAVLRQMPVFTRRFFLDVQPYKRGSGAAEHPLWLLHALSSEHRHGSIRLGAAATVEKRLQPHDAQDLELGAFEVRSEPFEGPSDIGWLRVCVTGQDPKLNAEPGFVVGEAFAGSGPASGLPLRETLRDILAYIQDEVFAARFQPYYDVMRWRWQPLER